VGAVAGGAGVEKSNHRHAPAARAPQGARSRAAERGYQSRRPMMTVM